mgnify:CR=1 FL=1
MAKKDTTHRTLIETAFGLAATMPWRDVNMASIADHAGIPLVEALASYPDKNAILDAAIADVSVKAMAECAAFTEDDTVRDRLFALLMARFDAMAPYRDGAASIARGVACDPVALIFRIPHAMAAMAQMLEAAGVDSSGLIGAIRTKGLTLIFASSVRVWLDDETEDLGPTMAALDRYLGRADMLARQLCRVPETP